MTSPIQKNGTPLSTLFNAYVAGTTKAPLTGIQENGTDLRDLYLNVTYGTPLAANTGITAPNGDLKSYFAKAGSYVPPPPAQTPLAFDGNSYFATRVRAGATLQLTFNADGTWQIIRNGSVVDSGSWLISGGTASQYTVQFTMTGFTSGDDPGGGTDSFSNGAATDQPLTSARSASASASAALVGNDADNSGTIKATLKKSGTVVSVSTCSFNCTSTGQ